MFFMSNINFYISNFGINKFINIIYFILTKLKNNIKHKIVENWVQILKYFACYSVLDFKIVYILQKLFNFNFIFHFIITNQMKLFHNYKRLVNYFSYFSLIIKIIVEVLHHLQIKISILFIPYFFSYFKIFNLKFMYLFSTYL